MPSTIPQKPQLSARERLSLVGRLLMIIALSMVLRIPAALAFAIRNRLPVGFYVACAVVRTFMGSLSSREIQHLLPTTRQTYESWIAARGKRCEDPSDRLRLRRDIQPLEPVGAAILWIGNRDKASKFVLSFHGGAFTCPVTRSHLKWCWEGYVRAGADVGVEVAVGLLQYSLAPQARFPVQLAQAAAALGALLDDGVRPADIIIGGDSAGGGLTLQLLGHLLHPHPDARRIELTEPLAALFTISPWISCDTNQRSYDNKHDMLSMKVVQKIEAGYFGGASEVRNVRTGGNPWAAPLEAGEDWLSGAERLASKFYITFGAREVLASDGRRLAQALRRSYAAHNLRVDEADKEAHDFFLMEMSFGQVGDASKRMQAWFQSLVTAG